MWISIIIICVVGTLLHFLYEFSGHNKVVALFAAVNESTWEHIKIALTPMIFYSLYDGYKYGMNGNYFSAKLISLVLIMVLIPVIFYSYKAVTKKAILPIDIMTFYVVIVIAQLAFYKILELPNFSYKIEYLSVVGLFIVFGMYMTLTLAPLKNIIFEDPISSKYGIEGHTEFEHEHDKK